MNFLIEVTFSYQKELIKEEARANGVGERGEDRAGVGEG